MAGHEWEDWFEREEFIGQISDIRVQNLQVERELVQKRTFTRWINLHLEKCDPPIEVHDLFQDIRDGHILMALLEELSGSKLLHGFRKSSHRIFRLNNIAKVLSFLEERNVKLVSIDAADVADGNSSIILGLIWNIILFFQIKELTGNIRSQFPSTSSLSSIPTSSDSDTSHSSTPSDERQSATTAMREHSRAIKKLLQWVQKRTRKYGVAVQDFSKSWTSGLAFLAVIKSIDSSLVDMRKALLRSSRENLEDAFRIAHYSLGIPRLLEPEDVSINAPDEQSIITYVSQFLEHFPGIEEPEEPCQLIERSVSMGRLYFRDSDSDHMSKSAHRNRVRERSYMFQKDTAHPPPKILISSVSEDRSVMSPSFKVTATRSWSSDDILTDSPHMEDPKKPMKEVLNNTNAPQLSYTQSPTSSTVPESVNTESGMGDSAISSPDSWVESEFGVTAEKDSENQSYLCDSGTAWHVYHATPVEVTATDEGFIPSIEEGAPDEQQMTECCIDEGIYTLSSLESIQERDQGHAEKRQEQVVKVKEANLEKNNQDLEREQEPQHSNTEAVIKLESEQLRNDTEQESSVGLCDAEIRANSGAEDLLKAHVLSSRIERPSSDHSEEYVMESILEESAHRGLECGEKAVDAQNHEGETNSQTESLQDTSISEEAEVETVENERENTRNEPEVLKESNKVETQDEASAELLKDFPDSQDRNGSEICKALENACSTNIEEVLITSLDANIGMTIPLISIVSVPDELDDDRTCNPGGQEIADDNVDQPMVTVSEVTDKHSNSPQHPGDESSTSSKDNITLESPSENVKPTSSGELRDVENQHSNDIIEHNISSHADTQGKVSDKCESSHDDPQGETDFSIKAETQLVDTEHGINSTDQPDGQKSKVAVTFSSSDTPSTQLSALDSCNTKPSGKTGMLCYESATLSRTMDVLYTDFDRGSPTEDLVGDPIEPMDLFYPDKEELMFTEPPDTESQNWPSVLSVSALQPAPASNTLPDDKEFRTEVDLIEEQDKVITKTTQETNNVFGSQQHCLLPGVKLYECLGGDVPAGRSDSSEAEQQELVSARENTVPVRCDTSFSRQDESQIPPVLRHRKGARYPESVDNQRAVTTKADSDDSDFWWSGNWELRVLLLLWLLLYCFWVLPQVDLKMLPDMLLNR
ncbi:calmin [Archocentrus centrarchus]|uniref:calmin n=1 Tax=Archocentrus centrarchus TaxID=63155 RepID=UPI0011E9C135|nr:calmin [Archocentrus centrarchus]